MYAKTLVLSLGESLVCCDALAAESSTSINAIVRQTLNPCVDRGRASQSTITTACLSTRPSGYVVKHLHSTDYMALEMLQPSHSLYLSLKHPTLEELGVIWTHSAASWKDALPTSAYLEESQYMTTVHLARDGGMTIWILVDGRLAAGQRPILSSCESFRKRALTSDRNGDVTDTIVHGIASVFCPSEYRGLGYPKRMMQELSKTLANWQTDIECCMGSILYSDIGTSYYAKLGWEPNTTNNHVEIKALKVNAPSLVSNVAEADLPMLCARDETQLRKIMAIFSEDIHSRMSIIPDLDHMSWHIAKENFACKHLFGKIPCKKGAIVGKPGNQIWAIWTHRYYDHPDLKITNNVLYVLRLVIEVDETASRLPPDAQKMPDRGMYEEQKLHFEAVLRAAQNEAFEWKLDTVQFWDPTPLVQRMLRESDILHKMLQREDESIASGLWYDEHGSISNSAPLWLNNEHYAWC